jgi:PDZ domain-containing protein
MQPRLIAALVATPLVLVLGVLALVVPLPFASFSPGPTFNILGKDANDAQIVQVDGHPTFYGSGGQLRFTTVEESGDGDRLSLAEALTRWFSSKDAVLPYDYVHPPQDTATNEKQQGAVQMVTSQDLAKAAALRELGYKLSSAVKIASVLPGSPAAGRLEVGDEIRAVDSTRITSLKQVTAAIGRIGTHPLTLTILRDDRTRKVRVTPTIADGKPRVGVSIALGYSYPFEIDLHVDPNIGGPSAGLMFALGIYDTLTPGSLTGGAVVAGTGELAPNGQVGPIGGIAQKIAAAQDAHAQLFFVPKGNCPDVAQLHPQGMRLVKATSVHEARLALQKWARDHNAELPSC